jgi:caffeoyl-CoA O-methyltransferase
MDILNPAIERYLEGLAASDDEPVLLEMEELARQNGFPIIGRLCGRVLEVLGLTVGAKRIFELGSGFGYSGYWWSRVTGPDGEIHLSDGDPANESKAMDFLKRAGLAEPITYHVGDAVEQLASVPGEFDIIYCDIDKGGYPDAWRASRERIRTGGLFVCDNTLWSGRVTGESDETDVRSGWTEAIVEMTRAVEDDPAWRSIIVPIRDGVLVAVKRH